MSIGRNPLPIEFEPFRLGYEKVGHRDGFLWRWVQRGLELTALPSVDAAWRGPNLVAKMLGVMLDVLLDDVADNCNYKDGDFLRALIAIPFHPSLGVTTGAADGPQELAAPTTLDQEKSAYFDFTVDVWREIHRLARTFPRYGEFQDVFDFDYRQLMNTMRYADLVNRIPEILNITEHDLYQPHNMHMMISGTLDLMCSAEVDRQELGAIRRALWRGQVMGRIGNMVSTWEREIKERDFTSGVFSAVIERGAISPCDLPQMSGEDLRELIQRSGVIDHFLRRWEGLRDEVYDIASGVRSVDLSQVAAGLEQLIRNHLGSIGLK